jgi:hypothetical protein
MAQTLPEALRAKFTFRSLSSKRRVRRLFPLSSFAPLAMAAEQTVKKKTYSLFEPRPKPQPAQEPAPPLLPPSTSSAAPPSAPAPAAAPPPAQASQAKAKLTRTASTASSRANTPTPSITLPDSDNSDSDASAAPVNKVKGKKKVKKGVEKGKEKGKKAELALFATEEEEDDLIIVESGAGPSKVKRKTGKAKKGVKDATTPKKKAKKAVSLAPSAGDSSILDLTASPSRPSGSGAGFASLSEVYKKERELRKAHEGVEPRWPTAEEHGEQVEMRSTREETRQWAASLPARKLPSSDVKGKGRARDETDDDFLDNYARQNHLFSPPALNRIHRTVDTRTTSDLFSLAPSFTSHPLLDRLAQNLKTPTPTPKNTSNTVEDRLWTVKYGPKTASEVFGTVSGGSALHLREWLEELKVQSGALRLLPHPYPPSSSFLLVLN